jgi:hypothetical protein
MLPSSSFEVDIDMAGSMRGSRVLAGQWKVGEDGTAASAITGRTEMYRV